MITFAERKKYELNYIINNLESYANKESNKENDFQAGYLKYLMENVDAYAHSTLVNDINRISDVFVENHNPNYRLDAKNAFENALLALGIKEESDPELHNYLSTVDATQVEEVRQRLAQEAGIKVPTRNEVMEAYEVYKFNPTDENLKNYYDVGRASGYRATIDGNRVEHISYLAEFMTGYRETLKKSEEEIENARSKQ